MLLSTKNVPQSQK